MTNIISFPSGAQPKRNASGAEGANKTQEDATLVSGNKQEKLHITSALPLEPLHFPLHESALIEASAGTGKTFTIAFLYVRLVLGHGQPAKSLLAEGLLPKDILVVTFTEAATKELIDRIRANLALAVEVFSDNPQIKPYQDIGLLDALKQSYAPHEHSACRKKLIDALELMDEAAISTIHSWCNRMLSEHAFDSGSLFELALETDQQPIIKQACEDYWRTYVYPLSAKRLQLFSKCFSSPDALQRKLSSSLSQAHLIEKPDSLFPIVEQIDQLTKATKNPDWQQNIDSAKSALMRCGLKGIKPIENALEDLAAWLGSEQSVPKKLNSLTGYKHLTAEGFAAFFGPSHTPFAVCELVEQLHTLKALGKENTVTKREMIISQHACVHIAQSVLKEQALAAQLSFDDLLVKLNQALETSDAAMPETGRNESLISIIAKQFPVALIDEFQDTDPVQFGIFEKIYLDSPAPLSQQSAEPSSLQQSDYTSLIMIGDPKQAIYSFRGGDIYTYLMASQRVGANKYTLGTNYRSTHNMVGAVNHLFARAENLPEKAFQFSAHGQSLIPFNAVKANGLKDRFVMSNYEPHSLTIWHESETYSTVAQWRERMAGACAAQITDILLQAQRGEAYFEAHALGERRAVVPSDIAILVNKKSEADEIRKALLAKNINSVYLSTRGSVLSAPEAKDILLWLRAIANPMHIPSLRNAVATITLGSSLKELQNAMTDELYLDSLIVQFQVYKEIWASQGVLPMLRRFMLDYGVKSRLFKSANGERALTDILHIGELLQQASEKIDGMANLISYYEALVSSEKKDEIEFNMPRLESDNDLIKVVTVHKSKGLQYPLVFLPFATQPATLMQGTSFITYHDDEGQLSGSFDVKRYKPHKLKELQKEEIRKLYVALTRAKYATWVGASHCKGWHESGLAYLTGVQNQEDDFAQHLIALAKGLGSQNTKSTGTSESNNATTNEEVSKPASEQREAVPATQSIVIEPFPEGDTRVYTPNAGKNLSDARHAVRSIEQFWRSYSYSSIRYVESEFETDADGDSVRASSATSAYIDERALNLLTEEQAGAGEPVQPSASVARVDNNVGSIDDSSLAEHEETEAYTLHNFYRGAKPGTFLHDILEWAGKKGFADIANQPELLEQRIVSQAEKAGWGHYSDVLCQWMNTLLSKPFPIARGTVNKHVSLAELSLCIPEMEFWFSTEQASLAAIDRAVISNTFNGANRPSAKPEMMTGILKGFIDLTFEHEGQYFVLDYKSNYLGETDEAYTQANIENAILHHRYDLQFVIYLVALHRLLKQRIADYSYERHVGGCVYYFLRGVKASSQGVFTTKPPLSLIEHVDALFAGEHNHPFDLTGAEQ
ncbi:exodeoxyribonuclease V subunit beta [Glaciecola siphonariae]|uniref:RecBCD enzyme subunit RecB n=1 Tax=Glaciecola siphonariae TaxID=521012 RepID=A0ABV9LVW7_9ALTE